MSKRILFAGLLAVGLSLALSDTAQAQYPRHYGHNHGNYNNFNRGYGGGYGYAVPVYRPVVIAPAYGYGGINSPYFGFGNSGYNNFNNFGGYNRGFNNGYGYNSPGVLNIGYSRPGFGISFGTIIR